MAFVRVHQRDPPAQVSLPWLTRWPQLLHSANCPEMNGSRAGSLGRPRRVSCLNLCNCSADRGWPSMSSRPSAGRCQPSRRPTRVDLPAPEGPTMAMCVPGSIDRLISVRIVLPPAWTETPSNSMPMPGPQVRLNWTASSRRRPSDPMESGGSSGITTSSSASSVLAAAAKVSSGAPRARASVRHGCE